MRIIRLLCVFPICILFAACVPTPDEPIVVQKDTDRLVETVRVQPTANSDAEAYRIEPVNTRYQYEYVGENGRLHFHADADVTVPASGKIPMMHVKAAGFSDLLAKSAFDLTYQGNPVYIREENGMKTKRQFAEEIAYYQELIDSGRTAEEEMDELGALEEIEYLKEQYEKAPLEAAEPQNFLSDGTMQVQEDKSIYGKEISHRLEIYDDIGYLSVSRRELKNGTILNSSYHYSKGPIENALGYVESRDGREFLNWYSNSRHYSVSPDAAECAYGQTLSPQKACEIGLQYFADLGLTEIVPFHTCDLYAADTNKGVKALYVFDYVRSIDGCTTAFVPLFQDANGYEEYELPWQYELIRAFIDDDGMVKADWRNPIDVTNTVSDHVQVIPYEDATKLFEVMCKTVFEPRTENDNHTYYLDLAVNHVELSLLRIREHNADHKVGLYVPAWIFYGTQYFGSTPSDDVDKSSYLTSIIFAFNAIDGSIIDLSKGY